MKKLSIIIIMLSILLSTTGYALEPLDYKIQRQQLERMRRTLIHEMSQRPEWMHNEEQVTKVIKTIMMLDVTIIKLHLMEQDDKEAKEQEAEYKALRTK